MVTLCSIIDPDSDGAADFTASLMFCLQSIPLRIRSLTRRQVEGENSFRPYSYRNSDRAPGGTDKTLAPAPPELYLVRQIEYPCANIRMRIEEVV